MLQLGVAGAGQPARASRSRSAKGSGGRRMARDDVFSKSAQVCGAALSWTCVTVRAPCEQDLAAVSERMGTHRKPHGEQPLGEFTASRRLDGLP